jgi:hypothetical protein
MPGGIFGFFPEDGPDGFLPDGGPAGFLPDGGPEGFLPFGGPSGFFPFGMFGFFVLSDIVGCGLEFPSEGWKAYRSEYLFPRNVNTVF